MSIKIDLLFLNNPLLLLLLILLMILLMFCFMQHYFYKFQPIMYDDSVLKSNNKVYITDKISKIIELKDKALKHNVKLLSEIIKDTKHKIQENFTNAKDIVKIQDFNDVPVDDLQKNLDMLFDLDSNIIDFENIDMANIQKTMTLIKSKRLENKDEIVKLLSNIYILEFINNINKDNISSYNEYTKYQDPKKNKYYGQYL